MKKIILFKSNQSNEVIEYMKNECDGLLDEHIDNSKETTGTFGYNCIEIFNNVIINVYIDSGFSAYEYYADKHGYKIIMFEDIYDALGNTELRW